MKTRRTGVLPAALVALAAAVAGCSGSDAPQPLPALRIDPASVTVSGISSGGYVAVQFHVAYSTLVNGAAVIAAGPYACAEGSLRHALGRCMKGDEPIPTGRLVALTSHLALPGSQQAIDPIAGLATDRVWLFHGRRDPYVGAAVTDALQGYYETLVEPASVVRIEHPDAGHTFPTLHEGSACDATESPFLGACGYDAAGELLGHLYGELAPRAAQPAGRLFEFDQEPYARAAGSRGLGATGWLYVPEGCEPGGRETCRLHIALHGCKQGSSFVGDAFARRAGYLEWAATNRIVVLMPQIERSFQPLNAFGCWDFWGYDGADYATRDGAQLRALRLMVAALLGEKD